MMFSYQSLIRKCLSTIALLSLLSVSVSASSLPAAQAPTRGDDFSSPQFRTQIESDRLVNSIVDYVKNWDALPILVKELSKKNGALSAADLTQLQTLSESLKRQLRNLQTGVGGITQSLKSQRKFTPELDSYINAYLRDKGGNALLVARYIEQENGARALLGSFNQLVTAQLARIDELTNEAKSGRSLRAHAPVASSRFVCGVLAVKLIVKVLKGNDTEKDSDDFQRECRDVTN